MHIMHIKVDLLQIQNRLLTNELNCLQNQDILQHLDLIFESFICSFGLAVVVNEQEDHTQHKIKDDEDESVKATKDKVEGKKTNIIKPWEELQFKRNKFGLGYKKNEFEFFHIIDYSMPIKIVSTGFLCDDLQ